MDNPLEASKVREYRFEEVSRMAARLMEQGYRIFCPIAHSHPIEVYGLPDIKSGDWWLQQDYEILQHCGLLLVYMMDGWKGSYGVNEEIEYAKKRGIPVKYINNKGDISDEPVSAVHSLESVCTLLTGAGQARNVVGNCDPVLRLLEGSV